EDADRTCLPTCPAWERRMLPAHASPHSSCPGEVDTDCALGNSLPTHSEVQVVASTLEPAGSTWPRSRSSQNPIGLSCLQDEYRGEHLTTFLASGMGLVVQ
ncbi:hypothetical protein P7K49_024767, partial [Saguinus oedipus]